MSPEHFRSDRRAERRAAVRRELDTKDAGGLRDAGGEAYLPLLYATGPFDQAIDTLAEIDVDGALGSRITGLREIAATIGDRARVTLDPTERHGFEYQSWFGFTLYGEGARGGERGAADAPRGAGLGLGAHTRARRGDAGARYRAGLGLTKSTCGERRERAGHDGGEARHRSFGGARLRL